MTEKTFERYKLVIDSYFVNGFNGRAAWQEHYIKSSDETADVEWNRILSLPKVQSYYKSKQENAAERLKTSHEVLLQELENWAYSDITETISLTPQQVKELPIEIRRLITKYKHTKRSLGEIGIEEVVELWFVSKEKAMEMIHKHVGFYEADNRQRTPDIKPPGIEFTKPNETK